VALLLDYGADVNGTDADGTTALMCAAYYGKEEVVRVLLERGADAGMRNQQGWTALDMAEPGEWEEVAAMLRAAPRR
jgi:ankyrin repeat protein